jgi:molybdate transport system substrate-binding protein
MRYVDDAGLLSQPARVIASNLLVLASANPAPVALDLNAIMARLDGGRLAVPLISSVPLGIYAAQALSTLGLLQGLRPHLAQQDNARASLISVLRQESPLGLLYASDVRSAPGVFVVADIAPDTHDPVRYLAAAVTAGGEAVVAYLAGPKGRAVFSAYGFLAP